MSVIIHKRRNVIREIGLRLVYARKYVSDILDLLYPSSALPKYKTALGFKEALRHEKIREEKSILLGLILGPFTLIVGSYMLDHNTHDPFAYFTIIWGISISILLGWTIHIKNEEQDEKLKNMNREFDEKIENMRKELDNIKNKT